MRRLIPVLCLGLAATLLASLPQRASSAVHLRLLRSDPSADTTLTAPPSAIRLWFSQKVDAKVTTVRVTGADDRVLDLAPVTIAATDSAPAVATIRGPVSAAKYKVAWRTMAADGHVVRGEFAFTVKAGSASHSH
jgi:copper resistance protein C